jgi:putative DNA primase/helicase
MRFQDFAMAHGVVVNKLVMNRWVYTSTTDHPHSDNGRYKFLGNVGWVQNWATMDKPATWFEEGINKVEEMRKAIQKSNEEKKTLAEKASKKATWILDQCTKETHPYLIEKGFPDLKASVWNTGKEKLLVVPMRHFKTLVGVQLINDKGDKKFLYGQSSKGATFTMSAKGFPIFCEGLATGLSVREVLKASNIKYSIYVCFSASNMKFIASSFRKGLIIADNDPNGIGEKTAIETGKPYWLSSTIGNDFNDDHKELGSFTLGMQLKKLLMQC